MAEREGFEPSKPCGLPLFESGQFNHSCISPSAYFSKYNSLTNKTLVGTVFVGKETQMGTHVTKSGAVSLGIEAGRHALTTQAEELGIPEHQLAHAVHMILRAMTPNARDQASRRTAYQQQLVGVRGGGVPPITTETAEHLRASTHEHLGAAQALGEVILAGQRLITASATREVSGPAITPICDGAAITPPGV